MGKRLLSLLIVAGICPVSSPGPAGSATDGADRICVIMSQDLLQYEEALAGFHEGIERRHPRTQRLLYRLHGDASSAPGVMQQVRNDRPLLLVTLGTIATQAAVERIPDIPVVAGMILRAEDLRKADNATGVVLEFPVELEFEWLRKAMPGQRHVGVLFSPTEGQERVGAAARAAARYGLTLLARKVESPKDLPGALENLRADIDVLWALADPVVLTPETARPILLHSFRNRIPLVGLSSTWVKAGALYALDRDYRDIGRQCGEIASKVLGGSAPSSLPPDTPRKVVYAVNLKTARHLKLELPEDFIKGAETIVD